MATEFNADEPLAFFLTWTTYGTWLPGDERGWNRKDQSGIQPPNERLRFVSQSRMKEAPFVLSADQRKIVETTIAKHCEIRGWHLFAVAVRSNHVHVLVTARGHSSDDVRNQLKSWTTRNLKKSASTRERFWTEGASMRSLNSEEEVHQVGLYIYEAQDRKERDV